MQWVFLALLFLSFWRGPVFSADTVYPEHPKDIRLTGSFLPSTEQTQEDVITVHIFLGDTPRLLRVSAIDNLSGDEKERMVDEGLLTRTVENKNSASSPPQNLGVGGRRPLSRLLPNLS